MDKFLINWAIGTVLTALSFADKHAELERAMLKVFGVIWRTYYRKPEFQAVIQSTASDNNGGTPSPAAESKPLTDFYGKPL